MKRKLGSVVVTSMVITSVVITSIVVNSIVVTSIVVTSIVVTSVAIHARSLCELCNVGALQLLMLSFEADLQGQIQDLESSKTAAIVYASR